MNFPSKEIVESLRRLYPSGAKVRLIRMNDDYAPPVGTLGEVISVDDAGTIHCIWQNGSSLGVVFGEDQIEKV